jgi:hypothetical protein
MTMSPKFWDSVDIKKGFYAALSIPFMEEKLGMYYDFFSDDIDKI